MPSVVRKTMGDVGLTHGPKLVEALQRLFEMGMEERFYVGRDRQGDPIDIPLVDAKTRVAALTAFVNCTAQYSGLAAMARAEKPAELNENAAELQARVVERLLEHPETRALVAAKLELVKP